MLINSPYIFSGSVCASRSTGKMIHTELNLKISEDVMIFLWSGLKMKICICTRRERVCVCVFSNRQYTYSISCDLYVSPSRMSTACMCLCGYDRGIDIEMCSSFVRQMSERISDITHQLNKRREISCITNGFANFTNSILAGFF